MASLFSLMRFCSWASQAGRSSRGRAPQPCPTSTAWALNSHQMRTQQTSAWTSSLAVSHARGDLTSGLRSTHAVFSFPFCLLAYWRTLYLLCIHAILSFDCWLAGILATNLVLTDSPITCRLTLRPLTCSFPYSFARALCSSTPPIHTPTPWPTHLPSHPFTTRCTGSIA